MRLTYPLTKTLVRLWCLARAVCAGIRQSQPVEGAALRQALIPGPRQARQALGAADHDAVEPRL